MEMFPRPDFDEIIDRIGSHSMKWDGMQSLYGLSPDKAIPMWVADMEFRPPRAVQEALRETIEHGVYGYFGDDTDYLEAIRWWMQNRHNWHIEKDWIFTTHGLVNGAGLCIEAFTEPGDGVVLLTPTYYSFYRILRDSTLHIVECPLKKHKEHYSFDTDYYDTLMTGKEKLLILCSPQNPGGQVWSTEELCKIADFARKHDLIVVSDEIHADLVYSGNTHTPMALAAPEIADRLVTMTSSTKTFNIAGAHLGNVIVSDPKLHRLFSRTIRTLGISSGAFGPTMVTAAYSPEGAAWVDHLMIYLNENKRIFDTHMNALRGVHSMPLQATYLSWVDFSDSGLSPEQCRQRIEEKAHIAAYAGHHFGKVGESFVRFNIACPRATLNKACTQLKQAFSDLV